jgi:hypothetical protein
MDKHPFSHATTSQESPSHLRRSKRIEFVTPVVLSGRDAAGQRFREVTQTVLVNLHGCKLRTSHRVLVGMLVELECPEAGTKGKAVCVKVWNDRAGAAEHEIAVQLIKPQNLWGVPDPPEDWKIVAKTLVEGPSPEAEPPTPIGAPPLQSESPPLPVVTAPVPEVDPSAALTDQPSLGTLSVDLRLAELEGRSARLMESFLAIMRRQAEEITRTSLEEFRQQVEVLLRHAEERLRQTIDQSYEASASPLTGLESDLANQMNSRKDQLIRSAEETLRARFREVLGTPARAATPESDKQSPQK